MLPKRHAVDLSQGDVTLPFDKVVCEETYFHGKQFLARCDSKRPENDFVKKSVEIMAEVNLQPTSPYNDIYPPLFFSNY